MKRITALIIVLLHVFVSIQDCDGEKSFTDLTFKIKALQPRNKDCKLDVLEYFTDGVAVRCDDDNGDVVRHLATCDVDSTNTDVEIFKCIDGEWNPVYNAYGKGTGTGLAHHRQKRWGFIATAFAVVVAVVVVTIVYCATKDNFRKCEDREETVENPEPPTYTNCPPSDLQSTYTAEQGSITVKVTWTEPVAHDDEQVVSNDLTCCGEYQNGDNFQALPGTGFRHTMTYTAKDNHGLEASCSFSFTAIYLTCDEPSIPENGKKDSCTQGYVYGSTCSYSCNTGYEMTGNADVTCQDSETWTPGPKCSKIECPAPSDLNNGNTVCDSSTTYTYDDDCTFVCNDGFKLNGPLKMTCQADKTWSVDMAQISCTDSEPPVISCQSPQVFYADRGTFSTSVSWKEPSANDTVDADPSITKIEGPELGDELQAGLHYVRYRATDSENNTWPPLSECSITLDVKVIKCSTGPTDALNNSRFMTFNCSDTSFYNGVTCQLGCDLNLPLNGTDLMTCERDGTTDQGIWNWGSGSQPYCEVVECPTLDPPDFGALAYDTVNARPINVMLCQKGFDISSVGSSFDGKMSCQDSGTWYPLDEFPDCIVSNIPIQFLSAELYYEGDCSDYATKEIIKEQLQQYFATLEADVDNSICPDDNTCKVENINLICGSTGRKRRSLFKRNVGYAIFTFEFTIQFQQQNLTTQAAYNHYTDILKNIANTMQTMIDDGDFDISGFTLSSGAFKYEDWPQFSCLSGNKLDGITCKPCPRGTYLNSTTGDCEYCNIGEYMDHDGALLCDSCADGYSTLSTGSKNVSKCIRKCSAGFQSSTTMEPCSACPIGTYQIGEGQTTCTMCPPGEITPSTNSTSVDQCGSFDLFVSGLDRMKEMANFNTSGNDVLTLAFWLKLQVEHSPDLTVQLTDTSGLSVALSFTDVLGITVGSSIYEINTVPLSHQKWTYIACTIDVTSQQFKLYTDNTQVLDETNVQLDSSVSLGESSLSITTPTSHGVYLSGISAYGRVLTGAEMSDLIQSCSVSIGGELMTMEDVKNRMTAEVVAVTPSVCDAINECESSPCGTHTCINEVDGFTCVCHGGMTGDLCDLPPDYCTGNKCYHGNCIPGNGTYTCDCTDGYSGVFCDREPVDGGWSEWGEWSACGAECNGGTRQRNRSCNNPTPGYLGNECQGSGVETEECNTVVCPKCPTLERELKTIVTCSDTDPDVTVCNMTCIDGTTLPNGQAAFEEYRCGKATAYEWTPKDTLPVCVEYSKPPQLGFINMATVTPTVATSAEEDYITHVQDGLSDVECVKSGQCSIYINLSSSSSRRKRSTGSTVTLQFTIVMTDQGELDLGEYLTSGTTTSSMSELLDAVNAMNNVTAHIQANMVSIFSGEVGGVQYTVDTGSLVVTALVYCDDGYAGTDGMCVQCPAGTRFANSLCISCDVGTYQSLPGQSSCITCPYGYTTKSYGSDDVAECSVVSSVTTQAPTSTQPTTAPVSSGFTDSPPTVTEGLSTTIIIGICLSVAAFIFSLIAIGCVLWKKLARKTARTMETNGSRASLNMIRPATNCRKINVVPNKRTTPSKPKFHKAPTTLTISDVELAQNKDEPPPYESLGFRETPFAHSSMSNKTT